MNFFNKKTIASALLLGVMSIGTASAMTSPTPLTGIVGVSSSELNVRIDDGVATLFGNVESRVEADLAKNHLASMEGIDKVIDLVSIN